MNIERLAVLQAAERRANWRDQNLQQVSRESMRHHQYRNRRATRLVDDLIFVGLIILAFAVVAAS